MKKVASIIRTGLDERLPLIKKVIPVTQKPARGWLRAVRDAVALSQEKVAQKIGVARQSYSDIELAEERGTVSLNSLQRAAEAMDCELVYFIVPRESVAGSYAELARLNDPKFKQLLATEHSMALEGQAVGDRKPRAKPTG